MFELHAQLASDTFKVTDLELCSVLLMNDARYPWVILVPRIENAVELHELAPSDYAMVMAETRNVAEIMAGIFKPKKMNVASLGNMVPQLHIHIIARHEKDTAWPGPVWGVGAAERYSEIERQVRLDMLLKQLK